MAWFSAAAAEISRPAGGGTAAWTLAEIAM